MTKTQKRLLLFDIDGTLIHSGGAGVHALILAFKERFGIDDDFHDIEIAGMTDSGIVLSILNKHKISATNENVSAFLDSYVHFLSLELPRRKGKLLPGVLELLKRLKSRPHVGYFIANIKTTADIKIGDTITDQRHPAREALPGFQEIHPMVFSGIYPINTDDLFAVRIAEFIVLVTKILPGVPQKQPAVFDVARRKHGYKMTKLE